MNFKIKNQEAASAHTQFFVDILICLQHMYFYTRTQCDSILSKKVFDSPLEIQFDHCNINVLGWLRFQCKCVIFLFQLRNMFQTYSCLFRRHSFGALYFSFLEVFCLKILISLCFKQCKNKIDTSTNRVCKHVSNKRIFLAQFFFINFIILKFLFLQININLNGIK